MRTGQYSSNYASTEYGLVDVEESQTREIKNITMHAPIRSSYFELETTITMCFPLCVLCVV